MALATLRLDVTCSPYVLASFEVRNAGDNYVRGTINVDLTASGQRLAIDCEGLLGGCTTGIGSYRVKESLDFPVALEGGQSSVETVSVPLQIADFPLDAQATLRVGDDSVTADWRREAFDPLSPAHVEV